MPIQPQKWHGEFRANLGSEGEGTVVPDLNDGPNNVTALTNGGFVATWIELDAANNVLIRAQLFDALGGRVGSEFAVNTNASVGHNPNNLEDGHIFDVAAQPGGGFVVAWARQINEGDIAFQRFSSTGAKLGGQTNVAGAADADREWDPSITMLTNGNFVVSWIEDSPSGADVHASVYAPSGALVANGTNLNLTAAYTSVNGGFAGDDEVAATSDGGFVLAHQIHDDIYYRKWSYVSVGGGTPFFTESLSGKVSALQGSGIQSNPAVTGLSNGGWAVAYNDEVDGFDHNVYLVVYNAAGGVVDSITLGATAAREGQTSIAAGPDGTFLVTWDRWVPTGVDSDPIEVDVMGQLFSNDAIAIGGVFQVNTVETGDSAIPVVTAGSDGRYAVAWMRGTAFGAAPAHTFIQILDGRDATITGNSAANTIVGHDTGQSNLNDNILGLGGNDFLFGLAGNDTMNGGAGADTMNGGAGNDTYFVDNSADKVIEASGGGTDTVRAGVSYALASGASVEKLQTLGTSTNTAINLTGNSLVNTLTGNAAANLLNGGGSADIMSGFAGSDSYFVDNAADTISEGAGQGTDNVRAGTSYLLAVGQSIETLQTLGGATTYAVNLTGNEIANSILGNNGANIINGRAGNDTLAGFGGSDIFRFDTAPGASNRDTISDFNAAADTVQLQNSVFTALTTTGTLAAARFNTGSAATQADDRIIYNTATGALLYDADGLGGAAGIQFATLSTKPTITAADFVVI